MNGMYAVYDSEWLGFHVKALYRSLQHLALMKLPARIKIVTENEHREVTIDCSSCTANPNPYLSTAAHEELQALRDPRTETVSSLLASDIVVDISTEALQTRRGRTTTTRSVLHPTRLQVDLTLRRLDRPIGLVIRIPSSHTVLCFDNGKAELQLSSTVEQITRITVLTR